MKTIRIVALMVVAAGSAASLGNSSQNFPPEQAAIRQALAERWEAQARADVATFATYFAEDADFVNVAGRWWRGRAEVAKELGAFSRANVGVQWSDSIEAIRFVRPDIAIVHVRWQTPSRRSPTGRDLGPSQGITTQVFVKERSRWYVSALQNTLIPAPQR